MSLITVLGASGFIGSALVKRLEETHVKYFAPDKGEILLNESLGRVIYCIGLTTDFRSNPFETVEAHVCQLLRVLQDYDFDSLTYLSSARVYQKREAPAREEDAVQVSSLQADHLYNISKIMGESLSLASGRRVHAVRLSNVYGEDFTSRNFLSTIISEAISNGRVTVHNAPEAAKDYVSIRDVVDTLLKIAAGAKHNIYNLASGRNVSNRALLQKISQLTGCQIAFDPTTARISYPSINIDRIRSEFEFRPRYILDDLGGLINSYRKHLAEQGA
jgi:nucleoside-diphosphate-sugar epimerase